MRLLLLVRHGQSILNVEGVVNGDPALDRGLSPAGIDSAKGLAAQISAIAIDLCVVSEFPRAQQTAELALAGRDVRRVVEPRLNDIRIGELEGQSLEAYRAWRAGRSRDEPFPGGESLNDAARRYAAAYRDLAERADETILCVCHEIPVRYAVNAAAGSEKLDRPLHDIPNATPYVFDEAGIRRAAERIGELAGGG